MNAKTTVVETLKFVIASISDCETLQKIKTHGSRADALAAMAPELVSRCRETLDAIEADDS